MPASAAITPRILVVDDERQVHSSLRLRLGHRCNLSCEADPCAALDRIGNEQFDLCITDVHMPAMDGLEFIGAARRIDPELGFVVLTAFDSLENLRRAIPLQVLEFLTKPFPSRSELEEKIHEWVAQIRNRRRERAVAAGSETLVVELEDARIGRDVELTASEAARHALHETSRALTSMHALLAHALAALEPSARADPRLDPVLSSVKLAWEQAESAAGVADRFFNSAYSDRDSAPAHVNRGLADAVQIAARLTQAAAGGRTIGYELLPRESVVEGISGIDFLLTLVPAIAFAVESAGPGTEIQIRAESIGALADATPPARQQAHYWFNRREAAWSKPGVLIGIRCGAPAFSVSAASRWFREGTLAGHPTPSRGLLLGIHKARGIAGIGVTPATERFELLLALPAS